MSAFFPSIERRDSGPAWRDAASDHGYDDAGDASRCVMHEALMRHAFRGDLTKRIKHTQVVEHSERGCVRLWATLPQMLSMVARPDVPLARAVRSIDALLAAARKGRTNAVELVRDLIRRFVWPDSEVMS